MKLTIFLFFLAISQMMAVETYSQSTRLSLSLNSVAVKDVLDQIEQKSEFVFLYNSKLVDAERTVSMEIKNQKISDVLDKLFQETDVVYTVVDRQIVLTNKADQASFLELSNAQQQKTISGKVTDSSGASLPGVSVVVKGTTTGVITDMDGKYSISKVPENATLQFSFVGMKKQEVIVGTKTTINVTLVDETIGIEEVVAVGYGTQSKAKLTSSISTLKPQALSNLSFSENTSSLSGRISGVIVQSNGGAVGSLASISIRGGGTPLFVIDGMIRDQVVFSALNKSDIESISVLKDAAATAVYGSRGANGIVLVTTKQGAKNQKVEIDYSNTLSWQTPTVRPRLIDSYNYARMKNETLKQQGQGAYAGFSKAVLDTIKNGLNPDRYPNTDWLGTVIRKYAPLKEHNLSVIGGNKDTKYFLGLGYLDQGSVYNDNESYSKRYSYRTSVTTSFDKIGLDVVYSLNGYWLNNKYPPYDDVTIWSNTVSRNPLDHAYNKDGSISSVWPSPLSLVKSPGHDNNNTYFNDINLTFGWNVPWITGLKLTMIGDYTLNVYNQDLLTGSAVQYFANGTQVIYQLPTKSIYNSYNKVWNLEGHVDYTHNWGKHNFSALLLYSSSGGNNSWSQAGRRNYQSAAVDQLFAGDPTTQTNNGSGSEWGRIGSVGRLKYDYSNKYFAELSGRYDGSDLFPKGNRFGFFPAISLGWTLSEENFFTSLKDKGIFNTFKLRASAGTVGNIDGISTFSYVPSYNLNSQVYTIGGNLVNGFSDGGLKSQDISWYTTKSKNIGFDFTTLKGHLAVTANYFYSRTSGYVVSPQGQYSATLGTGLPLIKSDAAYRKAGFDGEVSYSNHLGDLTFEIGMNLTHYNSLWEKSNESDVAKSNPYARAQGVLENYYGSMYESNGLYQSIGDVLNNARRLGATQLTAGDVWYKDQNGDGKIDGQDNRRVGSNNSPRFVYGIPINLGYKGWSLSALIQGTGARDLAQGTYVYSDNGRITYAYETDYWTPQNTGSVWPRLTGTGLNSSNNGRMSSFYLMDAQYIRLKSLNLSYDLTKSVLKNRKWINKCSVFVSGTNLLTICKTMKFFDPEAAYSDWSSGFATPINKNFAFGVNVGF